MTPTMFQSPTQVSRSKDFSPAGLQIAAILGVLVEKQKALDQVLDKQRNALIQGKLTTIELINAEAESLLSDIERIDLERESLAERIYRVAQGGSSSGKVNPWSMEPEYKQESIKLEQLMEFFPEEVRAAIEIPRQLLKIQIPVTRRKLGANSALAMNGSKIVHATLGILTTIVGREGPDKHQIYGAKGKTQYGRTQVRSLLNRKI